MKKKRIVTVFGSGLVEENFREYQKAMFLGRVLAESGFTVCNGGYGGIMEATARGAKQKGGKTVGIISKELSPHANRWIDQVKIEPTWKDRLFRLIETGNAFILFDGGTGTLTELFTVWEMANKRLHSKPIILYGASITRVARRLKRQRFVFSNENLKFATTVDDILSYLRKEFSESSA